MSDQCDVWSSTLSVLHFLLRRFCPLCSISGKCMNSFEHWHMCTYDAFVLKARVLAEQVRLTLLCLLLAQRCRIIERMRPTCCSICISFFFKCTIQFWMKSDDSEAVVRYYCIWQHWLWLSLTSSSVSSLQQLSAFWKMMPQLAAIQSKVPLYPADRIQNCKQAVILGPQMFTEHRIPDLAK